MITKEDIEKTAEENSERLSNIAYAGGGKIGQDDLETAFINGADWRINSIWHERTEPAKERNDIILLFSDGKCSITTFDGDWGLFITWMLFEKWAYLKDIFRKTS